MARTQPDTKAAVDQDLLDKLVSTVRPKDKCIFVANVERARPDLLATFAEAIERGVGATVIAITCRELGIEAPGATTITRHIRGECACRKAGS